MKVMRYAGIDTEIASPPPPALAVSGFTLFELFMASVAAGVCVVIISEQLQLRRRK